MNKKVIEALKFYSDTSNYIQVERERYEGGCSFGFGEKLVKWKETEIQNDNGKRALEAILSLVDEK